MIWDSPPTAVRNKACQHLRLGNIRVVHPAFQSHPGELQAPSSDPSYDPADHAYYARRRQAAASASAKAPPPSSHSSGPFSCPFIPSERIATGIQVNDKKFLEPVCDYGPETSPIWRYSLRTVNSLWINIWEHRQKAVMRGYAFLDPYVLLAKSGRVDIYFAAWLLFRSTCISRTLDPGSQLHTATTRREVPKPSPQEWRDFLFDLGFAYGLKEQTFGRPAKKPRTAESFREHFDFVMPENCAPVDIYWRGQVVIPVSAIHTGSISLSDDIRREIVWDLYEHNFRLELLALDCVIFPRELMAAEDVSLRDDMVLACFPGHTIINATYPS
ncbi:hypothetical protein CVT26_009146, partial [Gymnopilus dilepis]